MTESEAKQAANLVMELWPARYYWTPGRIGLAVEKFARPDWTQAQCEAVIRDEAAHNDARTPPLAKILRRCHEAHARANPRPAGNQHAPISPEEWAVIHRDRESAAAWWHDNRHDAAVIVEQACLAYPMFSTALRRFLDPAYRPIPTACMRLKCAWQEYHNTGAREVPTHPPGLMAGAVEP